jgi:hypothetical protein
MALFAVLSSLSTAAPDFSALSTRASTPDRSVLAVAVFAAGVTAVTAVVDGFALLAATLGAGATTVVTDVVLVGATVGSGAGLVETGLVGTTLVSGTMLDTVVAFVLPHAVSPTSSPPVSRRVMRVRVMPPESAPSVNAVRARCEQTVRVCELAAARRYQLVCASGTRLS